MRRLSHILLPAALLALSCAAAQGRDWLCGISQSPKGVGLALVLDGQGREMDIFTLRTDLYGVLSGRTAQPGVCLSYTHDYRFYAREGGDFRLLLHAGAGGLGAYVRDFEKGFLSAYERRLTRNPGWTAALTGNIGLRVDFRRRLTLDLSFSVEPGIHLRTDPDTGTLLVSLYRNGLYRVYQPQLNLLYRF